CTTSTWDAADTLLTCLAQEDPLLLIENKVAYGLAARTSPATHEVVPPDRPLGAIVLRPRAGPADVTLAAHGGMDELVLAAAARLEDEEVRCEIVIAQQISPIEPYF